MAARVRTTAEAIVGSLLLHGVDTVFGVAGAQTYEPFDALARAGRQLRTLCPRHEQAVGYMAFGYAKASGKVGVYTVVPGPGVLNSAAALASAWSASTPGAREWRPGRRRAASARAARGAADEVSPWPYVMPAAQAAAAEPA